MQVSIYKNNQWIPASIEVNPPLVKAQDTTNDTFSCILKVNTDPMPIKPMTPFKVVYDDNTTQLFWIINDAVNVFSLNPETYKHSLTLVQYRYFLNKHLIRNTVFNQPRKRNERLYAATTLYSEHKVIGSGEHIDTAENFYLDGNNNPKWWKEEVEFNYHHKIQSGRFCFKLNVGSRHYVPGTDYTDIFYQVSNIANDFTAAFTTRPTLNFNRSCFKLVDANNSNAEILVFDSDRVKESIENGYLEFSSAEIQTINNYIQNNDEALISPLLFTGANNASFVSGMDVIHHDGEEYTLLVIANLQLEVEFNLYAYNFYEIIQTLLNQYRLGHLEGLTIQYKKPLLFNLPTANSTGEDLELYNLLATTYPPDTLAFTQATFYEALTEIFRFFDAGFKFDENKTLKIEYYNEFERDISDRVKKSGISYSQTDKNFNSKRITQYQNAIENLKIRNLKTRSSVLGVPGEQEFELVLPKPIYQINKLELMVGGNFTIGYETDSGYNISFDVDSFFLDITPFVVTKEIWNLLDQQTESDSNSLYNTLYRESTLFYERGDNKINVSLKYSVSNVSQPVLLGIKRMAFARFFGLSTRFRQRFSYISEWSNPQEQDWKAQQFRIDYQVIVNGKVTTETITKQYEGEMLNNQNAGLIDLNKMGLSMVAESLKDGEPTMTMSYEIGEWTNRVKEGDYFIDSSGNRWIANVINYNILPNGKQKCNIEFSKNFNALAMRIQTDDEKRLVNISESLAVVSEDNYIDYVYVANYSSNFVPEDESIILNVNLLNTMIHQTFNSEPQTEYRVDLICVGIPGIYSDQDLKVGSLTLTEWTYTKAIIPFITYGSGNCICFEMQFENAASAGNFISVKSGWFGTNKYFSQSVPYTDSFGWLDSISINFYQISDVNISEELGPYPLVCDARRTIGGVNFSFVDTIGRISNLLYYKKPNEIFALNYEWCFIPEPNSIHEIFIGNKFINENSITKKGKITGKRYWLRWTLDRTYNYSILDVKGYGPNRALIRGITTRITGNRIDIGFKTNGTISTAFKWAIVDENNDIYFASNKKATFNNSDSQYQITIYTRRTRQDD